MRSANPEATWRTRDTLIVIILVAFALFLRIEGLGQPVDIVFDETYYARDACLYLGWGQEFCDSPFENEQSYVHPPVGKWLIAAGEAALGYQPTGWRIAAAIFGTAMVPLAYLLALRLFRTRFAATTAAFLVAADFLLIVQSRVAMLDIFLAFFILLGFLFLTIERQRIQARVEMAELPYPGELPHREPEWRLLAGLSFGLALATKWSGGLALAAAGILGIIWAVTSARAMSRAKIDTYARVFRRESLWTVAGFVVVPLVVYLLSYSVWFVGKWPDACDPQTPDCNRVAATAGHFYRLQDSIWDYHWNLEATHPYQSKAWTWPLVLRPVAYHYVGPPDANESHHMMAFGNPIAWYAALIAAVWLTIRSKRRWAPGRLVLIGWGSQYLPWLAVPRALFFFYMTPAAAFMMIGLAAALDDMRKDSKLGRLAVWAFLVLGIGLALYYFFPILTGEGLPYDEWRSRMWTGRWI